MARTEAAIDSGTFNTSIFIGLEIHSIAYTSLYFWIIPTSLFGSFIGVSQTEVSIPCILERFHQDLQDHFSKTMLDDPRFSRIYTNINTLRSYVRDTDHRQFHGGIYSWHPSRWQSQTSRQPTTADRGQDSSGASLMSAPLLPPEGDGDFPEPQPTAFSRFTQWLSHLILPLLIVLIPTIGGSVASSLVPPTGWNCRVTGEVAIFLAWFASALANILINYIVPLRDDNRNKLFWATFGKDLLIAVGTIGCVIATIVGALNRCDCWIDQNGGLVLPQREDIDKTLRHRLAVDYPAWIFSSAAVELIIIPGWVLFRSGGALKVFVQRDDGKSNLEWFWDSWDWIQRSFRKRRRIHTFNMGDGNAS